jgi:hypothetical protein
MTEFIVVSQFVVEADNEEEAMKKYDDGDCTYAGSQIFNIDRVEEIINGESTDQASD